MAETGFSGDFKQKILKVYSLFPELENDEITCGFIRKGSYLLGTARSWSGQIALQPNVGRMTIAHEMTHLLQGNGMPHGEMACDIWALARLPRDMLDERPYYLLRHWHLERWLHNRAQAKSLCEQAIEVRRTNRAYIKWLSGQLRQAIKIIPGVSDNIKAACSRTTPLAPYYQALDTTRSTLRRKRR